MRKPLKKTNIQNGNRRIMARLTICWLLILICCLTPAGFSQTTTASQLKIADYFADRMVLQREKPITVWGMAPPNSQVTVTFADKKMTATADAGGNWQADVPSMAAGGPFELKVAADSESKTLKDVMVGDVWLISGQSNVVLSLAATTEWPEVKTAPISEQIRVCKLPGNFAFEPEESFSRRISWDVMNPAKVGSYLSGVGYHFIRQIQPAVGVPVGLVQGAAGGTQVEQWTPEAALKAAEPDNPLLEMRDQARSKLANDAKAKIAANLSGATTLYNGTIHPFRKAKLKGVVWYQGEANTRSKRDYRPVLTALVKSWREIFEQPDLPFVIVQLPKFGLPKDDGWMRVQEAQNLTARDMGLALTVTVDQGSPTTIHPPNKAEVGRRAALAALQHIYKQDIEGTSPFPQTIRFQGDSAIIEFDGFKGDLQLRGTTLQGFELAGADQKFVAATGTLTGRRVTLRAEGVSQPKSVRYLWANSPEAITLFSAAGLPVGPFRSN